MNRLVATTMTLLALWACSAEGTAPPSSPPPSDQPSLDPSDPPSASDPPPVNVAPNAHGPGISVAAARTGAVAGPVLVNGYVFAANGGVQICDALLESYPPQCGDPSLAVEGLDVASLPGVEREGAVAWTAAVVQVLGTVADGVLTVSGQTTS